MEEWSEIFQPGSDKKTLIEGKAVRWGMFIGPLLGQFSFFGLDEGDAYWYRRPRQGPRERGGGGQDLVGGLLFQQIEADGLHALAALVICLFRRFLVAGVTAGRSCGR